MSEKRGRGRPRRDARGKTGNGARSGRHETGNGGGVLRCAVYTRKSTEEGLEQDFNSLDAQREACEAYIRSQGGLGWTLLSGRYDDGGVSGGTMVRPALQKLLKDIEDHQVDVVVVYKIDRLTRSLMDFSKVVEVFDGHGVSFVSVTQQFNTTTSMGRLTLNVLLSFAQFEREVTAERIRDKIAASKQKGMWMGGPIPLGYDLGERKLVVDLEEAERVKKLFDLYLTLKSVNKLRDAAKKRHIHPKYRRFRNGRVSAPSSFTRGHLYRLLSNPLYIGRVEHKGKTFPGQHEPIIGKDIWDKVQATLQNNQQERSSPTNDKDRHLLTGLVFDETGDRLCPTHANKDGLKYRYYVSNRLTQSGDEDKGGWRLPAKELEGAVIAGLRQFLSNRVRIIDLLGFGNAAPELLQWLEGEIFRVGHLLATAPSKDKRITLHKIIARIDLTPGKLNLSLNLASLRQRQRSDWKEIGEHLETAAPDRATTCNIDSAIPPDKIIPEDLKAPMIGHDMRGNASDESHQLNPAHFYQLVLPFTLRQRGVESKLILNDLPEAERKPDKGLVLLIARAHRWFELLMSGTYPTMDALAHAERVPPSEISRALPLSFLPPKVTEGIVEGRQEPDRMLYSLKRNTQSPRWGDG